LLDDGAGLIGCRGGLVTPVNPHARRCGILHSGDPTAVLDAVLDHLHRTRRRARQRRRRKLESGWQTEWRTESADQERAMTGVLRIERSSWKDRESTSMCSEPRAASFHGRLAREFSGHGGLRIELLHLDPHPVAHIFGVALNGVHYALKTSYDEAYRAWSPGLVLFQYVIERAFAEGLEAFDFLGTESRWKQEMSNDSRRHVDACAFVDDAWRCRLDASVGQHARQLVIARAPALVSLRRALPQMRRRRPG
jgi:CelD/BcsL family acetyltransferase involved in cellulose biosynthesis